MIRGFRLKYWNSYHRPNVVVPFEGPQTWSAAREWATKEASELLKAGAEYVRLIGPGGRRVKFNPAPPKRAPQYL